jgi:hypothetical protein
MRRSFSKDCASEQVMHQRDHPACIPSRHVKRNLVEVLDQNIVMIRLKTLAKIATCVELKGVSSPYTVHVDSIEKCARRRIGPSAHQEIHAMSAGRNAPEYLVEVNLCTAAVWIFPVVPVDDEDAH